MTARLLFVSGGTGGHVYPALAIAEAVRSLAPATRLEFAGGRQGIENRLVPAAGYVLHRFPAAGMRGLGLVGALRFALRFSVAFCAALLLVLRLRPQVVLATGGYASAAPSMAAAVLGRPLWIQEQNSVPGSTNRFLSRFAERAYCAFTEAEPALSRARRVVQVGNPVRAELGDVRDARPTPEDYRRFGLAPDRPTFLMFGGSRGAATLARALADAWPRLAGDGPWQAIAQVAEDDLESTRQAVQLHADRIHLLPFIDEMAAAYRVADVVLCRAGALTLGELAVVGRASVLVPYPHATDDHQTINALAFERAGAARVVADAEFDGDAMFEALQELHQQPQRRRAMAEAAARLAGQDRPAESIARALLARSGVDV